MQKNGVLVACRVCGKEKYQAQWQLPKFRACSKACNDELRRLPGAGAKVRRMDGYIKVYYPKHPRANVDGCILEHRLVMERVLGRPLRDDEHVHHVNGIKDDNRPENLQVMLHGEHSGITSRETARKRMTMRAQLAEYERRFGPLENAEGRLMAEDKGGKPNPGTKPDRRLSENRKPTAAPKPKR